MIAIVQRVSAARVIVDQKIVGEIARGLCVLASIVREDTDADLKWMADKLVNLRVFPQGDKAFDQDVRAIGGGILLVSNFTVSAATKNGRRPGFDKAMPPAQAKDVFAKFVETMQATRLPIATGIFGADMNVQIENDGPITLIVNSRG